MTEPPVSPKASRLAAPGWLDTRLVLGVLLVLVSVVVGARVLSAADRSQTVWVAARDLAPGTPLAAGDVARARVRLFGDDPKRYLNAGGDPPAGWVLRRSVGAGELLPLAALGKPGEDAAYRQLTVPVARGHLPPGLTAGSQVDVYVSPERKVGAAVSSTAAPRLVVRNVVVLLRPKLGGFAGGGSTDEAILLAVRPADVPLLLAAMSEGRIDLIGVPPGQEEQRPPVEADSAAEAGTG